ncbi:MAG: hypothetical protein FD150_780 [Rhodobacteraceae bacterium]|nr:MAG: hypothetical protein FD150_780 [Paracoccaceae bacterium]
MSSHITITPIEGPVSIAAGKISLGESRNALEMREGGYPPVVYVPRGDIAMGKLKRTTRATTCPWKGQASYYSITTPDGVLDNAVWSYEEPKADVAQIAGHLAFYTDRVTVTRG